jgi:hypothetical protein
VEGLYTGFACGKLHLSRDFLAVESPRSVDDPQAEKRERAAWRDGAAGVTDRTPAGSTEPWRSIGGMPRTAPRGSAALEAAMGPGSVRELEPTKLEIVSLWYNRRGLWMIGMPIAS